MEEVRQVEEGPVYVEEEGELPVNIHHIGGAENAEVGVVASDDNLADGPIIL